MKRMAAQQPFHRQQRTSEKAVPLKRLKRVSRTGRIIPARRRQPGRYGFPVKPYRGQSYSLHLSKPALAHKYRNCPALSSSLCLPGFTSSGYAKRIRSYPLCREGFRFRYASLPSRLARLRCAALPKFREKVKHIRLRGRSFFSTKSFAPLQPIRLPLLKTSLISFLPFKCSSRLKRKNPLFLEAALPTEAFPVKGADSPSLIGFFFIGNRQFMPAFRPSAFQYKPSAPCFHSRAKPEFAVSLDLAGLISPFHGIFSYPLYLKLPNC